MATQRLLLAREARRLLLWLIVFESFLVSIFAADALLGHPVRVIHRQFDLDNEGNIPAWFSSVQLFVLGLVFLLKGRLSEPDRRPLRSFFYIVGAAFLFLSMDESITLHETISRMMADIVWLPRFRDDHGICIVIYLPILFVGLLALRRNLAAMWRHYGRESRLLAVGAGMFLLGVVVLEIVSFQFLRSGSTHTLYLVEVALEEFLEMSGVSVMLYGSILLTLRD